MATLAVNFPVYPVIYHGGVKMLAAVGAGEAAAVPVLNYKNDAKKDTQD